MAPTYGRSEQVGGTLGPLRLCWRVHTGEYHRVGAQDIYIYIIFLSI